MRKILRSHKDIVIWIMVNSGLKITGTRNSNLVGTKYKLGLVGTKVPGRRIVKGAFASILGECIYEMVLVLL